MSDWLLDHYQKSLILKFADLTYGDALNGSQRLLKDLTNLFDKYFKPIKSVETKHMICGVGVSAVIDQLSEKICDNGEGILIATPYYSEQYMPWRSLSTSTKMTVKTASTVILQLERWCSPLRSTSHQIWIHPARRPWMPSKLR